MQKKPMMLNHLMYLLFYFFQRKAETKARHTVQNEQFCQLELENQTKAIQYYLMGAGKELIQ